FLLVIRSCGKIPRPDRSDKWRDQVGLDDLKPLALAERSLRIDELAGQFLFGHCRCVLFAHVIEKPIGQKRVLPGCGPDKICVRSIASESGVRPVSFAGGSEGRRQGALLLPVVPALTETTDGNKKGAFLHLTGLIEPAESEYGT